MPKHEIVADQKICDWCDKPGKMGEMARALVQSGNDLWLHDTCIVEMMKLKPESVEYAWFCGGCDMEMLQGPGKCNQCGYITATYKTECYKPRK